MSDPSRAKESRKLGFGSYEFSSVVGAYVVYERDVVFHGVVEGLASSSGSREVTDELLERYNSMLAFHE